MVVSFILEDCLLSGREFVTFILLRVEARFAFCAAIAAAAAAETASFAAINASLSRLMLCRRLIADGFPCPPPRLRLVAIFY
jgi:hypothetical protein